MKRELLEAKTEGYCEGRAAAQTEMEFVCMAREQTAYRDGRADEKRRHHRHAWGKLFLVMLAAHFAWALLATI